MELSTSIVDNLKAIQNSSIISDDIFNQLLADCTALTIIEKTTPNRGVLTTRSLDIINSTQADVATLFIEAARHKYDRENLVNYLQNAKIYNGTRIEKLCDIYNKQRDSLILYLSTIGDCLPCIVDVNWKLDYCIKTNTNNLFGDCLYHIRFVTKKHGQLEHVQFTCTLHQLQDLIYKLRDAVRHVEKISHI